jgi:large subunit ribosomal protein L6
MEIDTRQNVDVKMEGRSLKLQRHSDEPRDRAFHGLYYRLITNAIRGVTEGYSIELELVGVGYKAEQRGKNIALSVGKSHVVDYSPRTGITITTPNPTRIVISGFDRQGVGQEAARIRAIAPPEPYKGKGIRYVGETVRRKVGKSGVKAQQ